MKVLEKRTYFEVGVVLGAPVEIETEIGVLAVAETEAIIELTLSVTP